MRLELDARARRLLRRLPRTNLYSALELVLLAVLAVQCARLVWTIVTPVTPLGHWRPNQPGVAGSPSDILRGFDPFFRLSAGDPKPSVVTSLQLTLYGTRIDDATGGGSAIVAGPDGVQTSVAVGEEISPGVKLKSVAFDHVTVSRGGTDEDLFLDQSGAVTPVAPPAGGPPAMSLAGPPPPGGNGIKLAQIQSDIGFIPRVDAGRVSGLVVRSQGSGAAFRQAGLRVGDIVTAIGGRPVTGQGDIERLAAQYGNGGTLSLTVERGTDTLPLAITIAGQ
ncbi:type II secretory protein PulC [Sphingomonas sp. Leaf357]|uniref:type II secretion system protein N n=1 Tax=Sphingomonas sp. Leaf357 TaxID=1736350 RepID=UPI0006F98ED7|nr:type II secretion system protein N [Sphingomonas sp. Leaf357]KQS01454.1 type II secretory protein PulC [Sphingomonas sp. Leaf357]